MKRNLLSFFAAATLTLTLSGSSLADININIGIGSSPAPTATAPKVLIASPPVVILLPGTSIYFVPDIAEDVVFFGGYWYLRSDGRWFRGNDYNGPWVFISRPAAELVELSPGFRHAPPGHERIPYGQLKKNWKRWDEERHSHEHSGHSEGHRGKSKKHKD